jgi:NADH-quinone oxidoreductase subunit K
MVFVLLHILVLSLFITGLIGLIIIRNNYVLLLMCLELLMLAVILGYIFAGVFMSDGLVLIYALIILCLVAAESSFALVLMVRTGLTN